MNKIKKMYIYDKNIYSYSKLSFFWSKYKMYINCDIRKIYKKRLITGVWFWDFKNNKEFIKSIYFYL
jgi:hypothetical protein